MLWGNFGDFNNTYQDFTFNNFAYNINKPNITYMFLFTVKSKVIFRYNKL